MLAASRSAESYSHACDTHAVRAASRLRARHLPRLAETQAFACQLSTPVFPRGALGQLGRSRNRTRRCGRSVRNSERVDWRLPGRSLCLPKRLTRCLLAPADDLLVNQTDGRGRGCIAISETTSVVCPAAMNATICSGSSSAIAVWIPASGCCSATAASLPDTTCSPATTARTPLPGLLQCNHGAASGTRRQRITESRPPHVEVVLIDGAVTVTVRAAIASNALIEGLPPHDISPASRRRRGYSRPAARSQPATVSGRSVPATRRSYLIDGAVAIAIAPL